MKKTLTTITLLFSVIALHAIPTTPGAIKATGITHSSVKLDWSPSVSIDSGDRSITYEVKMRIRKKDNKPTEWAFHGGCCLANDNSVVIRNLLPSTRYEVRVVAYDSSGHNSKARIKENAFTTLVKPTTYQVIKSIPVGFSMMSIPFKFGDNSVLSIFGDLELFNEYLTIYKFTDKGFVVNGYDPDFGWDNNAMKLEPGEAIWVLNDGHSIRHRAFRGNISDKWRILQE